MSYKKWIIPEIDKRIAEDLAAECNIEPFLALMAYSRGYTDPFALDMFMSRDISDFEPFSFEGMEQAVERINFAIEQGEKILIYGDYDCDGVTSTALLYKFFKSMDSDIDYYIPDRHSEGYGMSLDRIEKIAKNGIKLIITVDNGINSIDEIDRAKDFGIDVIVTDHHIQAGELPDAVAVVNPHRVDSLLEFKDFAGVGVAFMLALAISGVSPEIMLNEYSDLVALGTIADVMPLKAENRSLVWYGVNKINRNPSVGIKALFAASGAKFGEISSGTIAFTAAPRINAAGRLGDASRAVELLISDNYSKAFEIAAQLDDENRNRQQIEQEIALAAEDKIIKEKLYNNRVIVVAGENWHEGVLGIAAARLAEKYARPVVLLTIDTKTNIAKGSARTVGNFSIFKAIDGVAELLIKYGGHDKAAGLSLGKEDISAFSHKINEIALYQEFPIPELHIDCKLNPAAVVPDLVYSLSPLEPYGTENPKPVFVLMGMKLVNIISMAGGKHLRLIATKNNTTVAMVLFGTGPDTFPFEIGSTLDFAVTLEMREFQGEEQLNVFVKDVRAVSTCDTDIIEGFILYEKFINDNLSKENGKKLLFDRNELATVYRGIRSGLNSLLKLRSNITEISFAKIMVMLDIMEELGLVSTFGVADERKITLLDSSKVDLQSSKLYCKLLKTVGE